MIQPKATTILVACLLMLGCGHDEGPRVVLHDDPIDYAPPIATASDDDGEIVVGNLDDDDNSPLAFASPPKITAAKPIAENAVAANSNPRLRALLVGCTKYDHLDTSAWLRGPVNDVAMFGELLTQRFGCPADQIRSLTEGKGEANRPTKANIVRELKQLANAAKEGDQVIVLLSGHGSQQPNDNPDDPNDPEPDGLDEIFCPADVGGEIDPDAEKPVVPNALSDDELRVLLGGLEDSGAFVWVIIDACHSGSATRGTEVYRQLAPETFLPANVLKKSRASVRSQTRGAKQVVDDLDRPRTSGKFVAIYAAQPHEPTIELPLPTDDDDANWRGLLTFTLAKVLLESTGNLTYRELVQRIHSHYLHDLGRLGPTPLIEGSGIDQIVLGDEEAAGRSQLIISQRAGPDWVLNGGRLQGLTKGTILEVFPPPGAPDEEKRIGYLEIHAAQITEASARPVEHDGTPVNPELPLGARCRPVQMNYGNLAIRVAIHADEGAVPDAAAITGWIRTMRENQLALEIADKPDRADWIIRSSSGVRLIPAAGWNEGEEDVDFASGPADETAEAWLRDRLKRISRVHRVLKVCGVTQNEAQRGLLGDLLGTARCNVLVQLQRVDPETQALSPVDWAKAGLTLANGDIVVLNVKNIGKERIDFSVLFLDSRFGITPMFPSPGTVADNRLNPGASHVVGPMRVQSDSLGIEHLVVIATVARGQPSDFSWLGQDSIEQAQRATRGTGAAATPIDDLLQDVLFSGGRVRGISMVESDGVRMKVVSWKTVADE